ncbi:MAG: hypothetical protein GY799_27130 [Desulfobulbaceae bacterium]|nr:hypothetical protein [Desulfobulbaceae bacterium]
MKNIIHGTVGGNVILSLLILIFLGAFGCSGVGRVVPHDHRLPFNEQDNSQGNFSHGGLKVVYSYSLAGGSMTMDGQVDYRRSVDSLDVRLLFLDASGVVLQQKIVYSSGYRVGRSKKSDRTFHETMVVPPGVAGLSFSYSAQPRSSHK